jgi:hypothetical protein
MENSLLLNLSNDKIEVGSKNLSQTANINKSKTTTGGPKTVMMTKMKAMLIEKMAMNQRRHSIL